MYLISYKLCDRIVGMDKFCYIEKILHTTKKEGFEMLFSSIPFLFWFLPFVLIFYFIVPRSLKNTVLLLSSLFFYGWGEPRYVFWMVFAILMGYVFGLLIQRFRGNNKISKLLLVLSVSSSLAILGYFKYGDFFI